MYYVTLRMAKNCYDKRNTRKILVSRVRCTFIKKIASTSVLLNLLSDEACKFIVTMHGSDSQRENFSHMFVYIYFSTFFFGRKQRPVRLDLLPLEAVSVRY